MRYLPDLFERPSLPIWQFPIAYGIDGRRTYTLREIVDFSPATKPPADVSAGEWRRLILEHLRIQVDREDGGVAKAPYSLICPEGTITNSRQAIGEIERGSLLGEQVVRSRREYLVLLLEDLCQWQKSKGKGDIS